MNRFNRVLLPTTLDGFDKLVEKVCDRFKISDRRHAAAVISVAIRKLPVEQAYTTYAYLAHYVMKAIANHVANYKGDVLKHQTQIELLENQLEADPGDAEARDKLYEAAAQGSEFAKEALKKLEEKLDAVPPKPEIADVEESVQQSGVQST